MELSENTPDKTFSHYISLDDFFKRIERVSDSSITCTLKHEGIRGIKHKAITVPGWYLLIKPTKLNNKRVFSLYRHKDAQIFGNEMRKENPTEPCLHYGPFEFNEDVVDFINVVGDEIIPYEI